MSEQSYTDWDEAGLDAELEYEDEPGSELQVLFDDEGRCREIRIGVAFKIQL